jgi:chromosome segregation ATPase
MSEARSELEELRAALAASEQRAQAAEGRADAAEADLARARAEVSTSEAMIAGLKLEIALLKRDKYGRSAERSAKLLDQLELQLGELVADAAEDQVQAERKTTKVGAFERRKPVKKAFPEHLPRERVVLEAPSACSCCGSDRIVKMGEDITETLEAIPRKWKVIQTVRDKFTCRACEKIGSV